jgi:hypothetical protein
MIDLYGIPNCEHRVRVSARKLGGDRFRARRRGLRMTGMGVDFCHNRPVVLAAFQR